MRKLRIRTFTLLCLFVLLTLPWLFFVTAHFMYTQTFHISKSQQPNETLQRHLSKVIHTIEVGTDHWTEPSWQHQLYTELSRAKMDVVIESATHSEIYRSSSKRHSSLASTEQFSVIEDGQLLGRVVLYLPKSNGVPLLAAFFGLLLAFFVVGVEMRRFLLKPLEKMSSAARQMASGQWEVRLPDSRITEIAEVRDGFEVMVEGLEESYRKQVELEEERRFVIAAVAHDLRTPLFALRGYLDGLEQGVAQSPEKITRYIAVCKEKSAQLDRLVEDLFTFTKMEYLESELNTKTLDLSQILRKSIESLSPQAEQKHISILAHLAEGCFINGDSHVLERAMNNVLENAVRYTPSGGKITVQCCNHGKKIKFTIRDTGSGFSSEELERVFEPLYRGEASRSRATGGSGLGLTISQRMMKQHGGELAVSNHPEGGAVLTGWIPLSQRW
ncbi:HAMP domain-containing sensor histidine kinase [Paenibacillus sp. F6_3S_P_1C]|uniref:histidine kinase n=1 Tax=Paenibacillus vandeheii TaxID=3035917 RepID=A0ABT8JCY6_9BACL|nr:HAMP domain-containing sensor histidine kinase [Paenibacillus vandeheii]MDN4602952.1 HAMP domain-containing sensor histidine kinase [Paenibacillus vandeheii]